MRLTLLLTLILFSFQTHAGRVGANISLRPNITTELNKLLFTSENLRSAILGQDEDQIEICLRELLWQVDQTRASSAHAKDFDRTHLLKILDNIKGNLEMSFSSYGTYRKDFFIKIFNQFANIVRIYQVDSHFAVFYCPKDHATWIQATNKPENPFSTGRGPASVPKDCGIKIRKP